LCYPRGSLEFSRKACKDHPGDHVAAEVDSSKSADASNERRSVTRVGAYSNLGEGITVTKTAFRLADAREVDHGSAALVVVALELVDHESVVSVLEDRNIFELSQEDRDVGRRHEESSEEHERDDQYWGQSHSQLLVRETAGDDQGVAGTSVVDQSQNSQEYSKLLKAVDLAHADSKVNDGAEEARSKDGERQFRDDLGPEVRRATVHVVVDFTEEDRPFVREDEDDVLDGVEGDVHADKEESSLEVLDSLRVFVSFPEQENGEQGGEGGGDDLHVRGLGETH